MTHLVKRLNLEAKELKAAGAFPSTIALLKEAAARIADLEACAERLREALEEIGRKGSTWAAAVANTALNDTKQEPRP